MFKGKNLSLLLMIVSILLAIGCKKDKETSGKIIARVDNKSLTIEDFLKQVPAQILIQTTAENRKLLLESWVANEIVYKDAVKNDFLKKPEVQEKVEQFKRQLLTSAYMQEILSKVQFVSDLETRSHFEKYKDDYNSIVEVSHISSDSRRQAEEVLSNLNKGVSFVKLAKEYSTDSETADNKGYLGSFRRSELAAYPLFEEAVFKLKKPGEISGVVETEFGFDIIKLHSRKKSSVSYEDVSQSIIMGIRTKRFQKRSKEIVDSLKEVYSNEIFPEVLEQEMGIPSVSPGLPVSSGN